MKKVISTTPEKRIYTLGSLFSGIGGFELGFEMTKQFKTIWQCEIDPFARAVLAKHWPGVQRFEDVKQIGKHNLNPVDIIVGGFPCQDASNSGKRAGINGSETGLWREFARIIRELNPPCVVLENVPGLLVRGFEQVLNDLAASGFDAEWDCLPASAFGAYHERERLFIVAYPQGNRRDFGGVLETGRERKASLKSRRFLSSFVASRRKQPHSRFDGEPSVARMVSGFRGGVHQRRMIGNSVYPYAAQFVAEQILESGVLE